MGLAMLLGVALGLVMHAQEQMPAVGGSPVGSVTGHVMAQDTQKAARFARVMLQSVPGAANSNEDRRGENVISQTDADGNFTADHVAPGDYYVTASAPGYISERALLQAAVNAGASPAALLAQIPVVHVAADSASSIVVTIERGATISGRVQWEDGTPATGMGVRVASPTATNAVLPGVLQGIQMVGSQLNIGMTDDRGVFRVSGLTPGDYLVQAQIQPPTQNGGVGRMDRFNSAITVYSPGVFHKAEAKVVSVGVGEERIDVRLVIDLRGLRTVSGHVASADPSDSVASGQVTLTDPNSPDIKPLTLIAPNGDFTLRYVPAGSYTLQVMGASTQSVGDRARGSQGSRVSFQDGSQAVTVADRDVTDVAITLTPSQSSQ
jgi:hypothetical protein